jgi:hypothetical protein
MIYKSEYKKHNYFIWKDLYCTFNYFDSSRPDGGWEFFSPPLRAERFGGPSTLLSNGYQGIFPWG